MIVKDSEIEKILDTNQIGFDLQVYELPPGFCEKVDNKDIHSSFVTVKVDGISSETVLSIEPISEKLGISVSFFQTSLGYVKLEYIWGDSMIEKPFKKKEIDELLGEVMLEVF